MDDKKILKEYLIEKNITQTELAKINGLKSQGNISRYLLNKNSMRMDIFTKLINSLGGTVKVVDDDSGREWIVSFDE